MYNIKLDDIDLKYFGIITSFKTDLLPTRIINSYSYELMDGVNVLNEKYDTLEIKITIFVEGKTEIELEERLKELRIHLSKKSTRKLLIDDKTYYNVKTTDSVEVEKFSNVAKYVKITLEAPQPYEYDNELNIFEQEEENKIIVTNGGSEATSPAFSVGISEDSSFIQLESESNKILVGEYPQFELANVNEKTEVLHDECSTLREWTIAAPPLMPYRRTNGNISITSGNSGIRLSSTGETDDSNKNEWKGACVRKNLSRDVEEFDVKFEMTFDSTGTNGDPTKPTSDEDKTGTTTIIGEWYEATASTNYRTGDSTKDSAVGKLKKGDIIKPLEITRNGWIKFNWDNGTYYVSPKYMKKITQRTVSTTIMNYYVTYTKAGRVACVMDTPYFTQKALVSVEAGTLVRCYKTEVRTTHTNTITGEIVTRTYLKLAEPYKGHYGYILKEYLTQASQVNFSYEEKNDYKYADWKTGVCEVYGFSKEGAILWRCGIYDNSSYFENNIPFIAYDGTTIYADKVTLTPNTYYKKEGDESNPVLTQYQYLSGAKGNWNNFRGHFSIKRYKKNNKYYYDFGIHKLVNGVYTKNISLTSKPSARDEKLSYIAIYFGTLEKMTKCSDMSIESVTVNELNPQTEEKKNILYFKKGDIVDITENLNVFVNGINRNELLDVGSREMKLPAGTSQIKVISDDKNIHASAIIQNKWIGGTKC